MHFATLLVVAGAAITVAQSTTSSAAVPNSSTGSTCDAEYIVDACLASTNAQLNGCKPTDYDCLCGQWTNVLTCYNNCPNDSRRFSASQSQVVNCNAAKQYGSSAMSAASASASHTGSMSTMATSATSTSSSAASSAASSASRTAASSASAASASATGAASSMNVELTGGLLAVVAAGFGLFL